MAIINLGARAKKSPLGDETAAPYAPQQYTSQPQTQAPSTPAPLAFADIPGYDYGKLSDPTHRGTGKYNNDIGLYSQGIQALNYGQGSGFTPSEATLTALTDWMNQHGGQVSRQGDHMTFANSLDAQGKPYSIDVATDYNPNGGNGAFSFQDPRGNPDYNIDTGQWRPGSQGAGGAGGAAGGAYGAGGAGGGGVFTDPATADWEAMLRKVTGQLSTPTQTPGYNNLVGYLQSYMKQLQQPGYSPAEAEQIQTQSLDPMTQERDAAKQRVVQQYAAKGQGPSSGPTLQAIADIDKQYEQMRTKTQADFATQAAGLTRQNAGQAAQVGQSLQALEQGQQTGNEARAMQAVQMMFQLPQLADTRLGLANQTLNNQSGQAAQLMQTLLGFQNSAQNQNQFKSAQDQAYWQQLGTLLAGLFT